jgi:general secretion pathway protein G
MSVVPRWAERHSTIERSRGFTLLELVIVITLVVILFLTAFWRLLPLRGDAEAAHVATTIGTLRSNLGLVVTERILADSLDGLAGLEGANPMALLARPPGNYVGELDPGEDKTRLDGNWYFDEASRALRYRLRYPQYLADPPADGPVELAWRVELSYSDHNDDGRYQPGEDTLRGVRLGALDNPGWAPPDPSPALGETGP